MLCCVVLETNLNRFNVEGQFDSSVEMLVLIFLSFLYLIGY